MEMAQLLTANPFSAQVCPVSTMAPEKEVQQHEVLERWHSTVSNVHARAQLPGCKILSIIKINSLGKDFHSSSDHLHGSFSYLKNQFKILCVY